MRSGRRSRARCAAATLLCCCAALAFARGAAAQPLVTGVSGLDSSDPIAFERIKGAGAEFVQIAVPWGAVAPAAQPVGWHPEDPGDPAYDWAAIDAQVQASVAAQLTPVLLIDGGPAWAQRCKAPFFAALRICDSDPAALAAFATAAARRYSGAFAGLPRVRYWQGLNEPNLSLFFNPQFDTVGRPLSPGLYRQLINTFYTAVKAVNPSNLVLAAGLGPVAVPNHTIGPMRFARALLCMTGRRKPRPTGGSCGGGVRFDIFDVHPYTTGGPSHQGKADDVELADLEKLQELLAAADRAGRIKGRFGRTPLWITEFSWDSSPPDPGGLRMSTLTRWTAVAMYEAWSAGVDHFFWYSLRDFPTDNRAYSETVQSGLYFRGEGIAQDRPKRLLSAFRFPFVAFAERGGFSFWGRTPASQPGTVRILLKDGARWRTLDVARAVRDGVFQGFVEPTAGVSRRSVVRARFRKELAIPFSLRELRDFHQPPFG